MTTHHRFFQAIGIEAGDSAAIERLAAETGISIERLKDYDTNDLIPTKNEIARIAVARNIEPLQLMLLLGYLDREIISALKKHAREISELIQEDIRPISKPNPIPNLVLTTEYGKLYRGDCLDLMREMPSEMVDVVFADPPFNLNKDYPSKISDDLQKSEYISWCEEWLEECIRILKPRGSLFLWNIPKWNTYFSSFLNQRLSFRHWIAVDIKSSFPIAGKLYPSHYSLLYYCKGEKPKKFHPDRLPAEICQKCYHELRDYGGYKNKMNPKGVNLTDVWYDIFPVRHPRYKRREGANELSLKLLDRVLEMSSEEGDLIFDPFGGAGTTYLVAELKKRHWIGIEIGEVEDILERFQHIDREREYLTRIREEYNCLFTEKTVRERIRRGLWTTDPVKVDSLENQKIKPKISPIQYELEL